MQWIYKIFDWFQSLWDNLPEENKNDIIDNIVNAFASTFRAFHRAHNTEKAEQPNDNI